jgi:hypothetical protein
VLQRNNDILVCSILEIVRDDSRVVLLDGVVVRSTLLKPTEVPGDDVFACGSDDCLLRLVDSCVKSSRGEVDSRVHVCDVFWLELKSTRDGFGVGWETSVKAQGAFVSAVTDQSIDEKKIGSACCD